VKSKIYEWIFKLTDRLKLSSLSWIMPNRLYNWFIRHQQTIFCNTRRCWNYYYMRKIITRHLGNQLQGRVKRLAQHKIKLKWNSETNYFSVSELFQSFSHVEKYLRSHMWNKTVIKHCRRCSREITVILFQFHFMLCEPLYVWKKETLNAFSVSALLIRAVLTCLEALGTPGWSAPMRD